MYAGLRVGKEGKVFKCWKFRTMCVDAEEKLSVLLKSDLVLAAEWKQFSKLKNDPRMTKTGRILRKTSLDELPQFINVLRGEMSAVGPRPLVEADVVRLGWTTSRYDFRWRVRPGLTGLAQVVGPRTSRATLFLDRTYVGRQNLWLDVRLIALSFAVNALGKRRVRQLIRPRAATESRVSGANTVTW